MEMRILYHGTDEYAFRFIRAALEPVYDPLFVQISEAQDTTLRFVESTKWDLVVVDSRDSQADNTPVLVSSVRTVAAQSPLIVFARHGASVLDEIVALRSGADDWVGFPMAQAEFAARCNALLRRVSRLDPVDIVRAQGELWFNESLHQIVGPSGTVTVTCTEARLLACLMRHPGRYVSSAELLRAVWDSGPAIGKEQVKVGIYRLRQKLLLAGIDGSAIEHHRGAGYRVNLPAES